MGLRAVKVRKKDQNKIIAGAIAFVAIFAFVGFSLAAQSRQGIGDTSSAACASGFFSGGVSEANGTLVVACSRVGWTQLTGFPSPCPAGQFVYSINSTILCSLVSWSSLNNFPSGCVSGQFVTAVGLTVSCAAPTNPETGATAQCNAGQFLNTVNETSLGAFAYFCQYPDWSRLTGFPSACPVGQFVAAVGISLTCVPLFNSAKLANATTAQPSLVSTSVGLANSMYMIGGDLDGTIFVSGSISLQVSYTDWNGASQTITIVSTSALGDAPGNSVTILAKASTSITLKTTGIFIATYNVGCWTEFVS